MHTQLYARYLHASTATNFPPTSIHKSLEWQAGRQASDRAALLNYDTHSDICRKREDFLQGEIKLKVHYALTSV